MCKSQSECEGLCRTGTTILDDDGSGLLEDNPAYSCYRVNCYSKEAIWLARAGFYAGWFCCVWAACSRDGLICSQRPFWTRCEDDDLN